MSPGDVALSVALASAHAHADLLREAAPAAEEPVEDEDDDDDDDDDDDEVLNEVVGARVVYPQEPGELQVNLEASYLLPRQARLDVAFEYEVEIGLTRWWQLELGLGAPTLHRALGKRLEVGVGHAELSSQWTWMHMQGSPFSTALALEVELPLEYEGSFAAEVAYEPMVMLAVEPPTGRAIAFLNVGAELEGDERTLQAQAGVAGAIAWARPYLVVSHDPDAARLVPGTSVVLPKGWEIVLGVPVGLGRQGPIVGASLIVIYEIELLERRKARAVGRRAQRG